MTVERRADPAPQVREQRATGRSSVRVPYPIGIRTLEVLDSTLLTPRMLRLRLGGPDLAGFCTHEADDHVKVFLPEPDGTVRAPTPNDRLMLDWPKPLPTTRVYTVRHHDAEAGVLDLDVVLHDGGLASDWLRSLGAGDAVVVAGPPGGTVVPHTFDRYVLAVDATGLPAAARWLETAPAAAEVHLVIEVADPVEHAYPVPDVSDLSVVRLVRGETSALAPTVETLGVDQAGTFLFAAGEADDVRPLRTWGRGVVERSVAGYWRRGQADYDE